MCFFNAYLYSLCSHIDYDISIACDRFQRELSRINDPAMLSDETCFPFSLNETTCMPNAPEPAFGQKGNLLRFYIVLPDETGPTARWETHTTPCDEQGDNNKSKRLWIVSGLCGECTLLVEDLREMHQTRPFFGLSDEMVLDDDNDDDDNDVDGDGDTKKKIDSSDIDGVAQSAVEEDVDIPMDPFCSRVAALDVSSGVEAARKVVVTQDITGSMTMSTTRTPLRTTLSSVEDYDCDRTHTMPLSNNTNVDIDMMRKDEEGSIVSNIGVLEDPFIASTPQYTGPFGIDQDGMMENNRFFNNLMSVKNNTNTNNNSNTISKHQMTKKRTRIATVSNGSSSSNILPYPSSSFPSAMSGGGGKIIHHDKKRKTSPGKDQQRRTAAASSLPESCPYALRSRSNISPENTS